ncbi:MAG TPA: response regulator [Kofleriaceae bacterium]|jgi:CheY-like chemotaxis protein|nr:response regulator [Kofleriaceae bacterium]
MGLPGRRILLVDDDVDTAEILRDVLALRGHTVEIALDGEAALQTIRALRPELVLCDLGLPKLDGLEVAAEVRRDPSLDEVVLVAVTGHARLEDRRRALAGGFDDHVGKPLDARALDRALAATRARAADADPDARTAT